MRPAPLSEFAGPQERVQRGTVEQVEEFVPVVQILDAPVLLTVDAEVASIHATLQALSVPR